jgi:hypothetical protein
MNVTLPRDITAVREVAQLLTVMTSGSAAQGITDS